MTDLETIRAAVTRLREVSEAATDGPWEGEKHVRLIRRDPVLGCDIPESYVKVNAIFDLRAVLAQGGGDQ